MPVRLESRAAFRLRVGTSDETIYEQVVRQNEYRLPARLPPGSVVVDIGAHIGTFSYLALMRGSEFVYAFEPEAANHACATRNLAPFGRRVQVHQCAVWRSDQPPGRLNFMRSKDASNTGGGTLIWETQGELVDTTRFDDVVLDATARDRHRIDLLKLDCEGAEFPILLTSKLLNRINHIVGEYHELRGALPKHTAVPGYESYAVEDLAAALEGAGFAMTWRPRAASAVGGLGLFMAHRRDADHDRDVDFSTACW
jgi:FkbM family methyltransferase